MSTTTTNLELVKPAGNERVDVDVINGNYDKIDEFAGLAITDANYVHTDNNYTTTEKNKLSAIQPNATATSFTQTLVSGTAVGTITINGTPYTIYAPASSGGASALNDLSDVTLANPSNGQVLKYNATTGKWENADESGGGGGYIPTGEVYTFFTDGSSAAANYTLYVQWTDGETVTTAVIVEYAQIISGWTTGDYQNVTINWDRNNACFNFVAKTGSFENGGNYYDEGDTMGTLTSGNITFNAVEKEATGVEWTQIQSSGTKIAEIEIDGVSQNVYAPTPPTKTSDLTNDSNFVADASYVHTDNNYTATEKNKLSGLVAVEANPSGTASTDLTKIAIGGTNYNIPSGGSGSSTFAGLSDVDIDDSTLANGQVPVWNSTTEKWENGAGGSGTTVVPNPQGTPTGELNTIQIGNDIYEIAGGSSGGSGFERTNLYTASATETVVSLSQNISDFDMIELISWYDYNGTTYTESAIYSASDMVDAIGTAKAFGVYNDAWFTYYRVNAVDEIECVANNNSWYVQEVYGLKFGASEGSAEWTDVVGTLEAGQTTITLSNGKIKANSVVNPYASKVGVKASDMVIANGSVTLTFPVQTEDLDVMVRVTNLNADRIYQIPLTAFDGTKVWYRYGSTAGAEAISTGLKISGNDQRNDWIGQSVICIDLNEFDIPDYFEKMYIHLVSGDTSGYAGLYAVSTNTLYSQSSGVSDADLLNATKINSAILWNYINGISVSDYVFEIECLPSAFGRYLYIMGSDGLVPEGGISNTNNGSWNFVIDGIGFE